MIVTGIAVIATRSPFFAMYRFYYGLKASIDELVCALIGVLALGWRDYTLR
jgi:hypothetical protein